MREYQDSPFKEILAGGISVLSTKFEMMGETAAKMILQHKKDKIKNPFFLIVRPSL